MPFDPTTAKPLKGFDPTTATVQVETDPRILSKIVKYYTEKPAEPEPSIAKGVLERSGEKFKRVLEPTVLGEAAREKTGLTGAPGAAVESIAGTPERMLRTGGAIVGTAGEAAGGIQELIGRNIKSLTGGQVDIGKLVQMAAKPVLESEPAQKAMGWWESLTPAEQANFETALDLSAGLGMKGGEKVSQVGGELLQKGGKSVLGGQLKIKKSLAQRGYGSRIDLKKKNIIDNIAKYDLESVRGNFGTMAERASKMATDRVKQADDILSSIAASPDAPRGQFVDDIIMDAMDKIEDIAAVGKEPRAQSIIDDIIEGAASRGMSGDVGIDEIVKFKQKLDPDGNLFRRGPGGTIEDNLEVTIRKEMYRSAVNKIRETSPDAADLNKQAKELIDISNVAGDAAARTANWNKVFSMSNMLTGLGGAGMYMYDPKKLPIILSILGAKAAGGAGRGPAALIEMGKALGSRGIEDLLKFSGTAAPADISKIVERSRQ